MKYKILKLDKNDRITFTKEEIEALLDEVYEDGRKDGYSALFFPSNPLSTEDIQAADTSDIVGQIDWDNVFTMQTPVAEE